MTRSRTTLFLLFAFLLALLAVAPSSRAETTDFTLTVNTVGNGTVNVDPAPPYTEGQQVTLTAVPDVGWKLGSWTSGEDVSWHDGERDFRVPVTVNANGFGRKDKPVDVEINFQQILNSLGGGTFNPTSVRVVEVNAGGELVDGDVPFQFAVKKTLITNWIGTGPCATDVPGQGTVTFIMEGNTAAGGTRTYQIYFDKTGKTVTQPSITQQIKVTDSVQDEGYASIKVETPTGTLFYHKKGMGFSSYNDVNGNDWISYNATPEAGGRFRGIPNAVHPNNGGDMHPGPGDSKAASCILNAGPIKATVYSNMVKVGSRWTHTWDFYPGYTRHSLFNARFDYYWLYEGTPGGTLEPNKDFVVWSDGVQINAGQTRESDIPGDEWGFVADPDVGRAIFLIKEEGDELIDSYRDLDDQMTVFAFGRNLASKEYLPKTAVPAHYIFGLMDETTLDGASPVVNNTFKALAVTAAAGEQRTGKNLGNTNPLQFTITGDDVVTATFVEELYTLNVSVNGSGTVTKTPDKASYEYNEVVTLEATPGSGVAFTGWSGDLTGATNPVQVTMTGNKAITATFSSGFSIDTSVNGQGSIEVSPELELYPSGTEVTVTAVPAPGWEFTSWSGNLVGSDNPKTFAIGSNVSITANFVQGAYTLSVNAGPNGSVDWFPKKDTYDGGEEVTFAATPADGFAFAGWTGDLVSDKPTDSLTITKNSVVTATFKTAIFYPLAVNVVGQGTVNKTPDAPQYLEGTVVGLQAVPATNWAFVGWSGALSGSTNPTEVGMDGPKAITATFQQTAYSVNVSISGDGSVVKEPNKTGYSLGEVVTITATAADNWVFTGWTGTEAGTTNPLVITVSADETIVANFSPPLTLQTSVQGSGSVQVVPEKAIYAPGEQVVLTAVPDDGWIFAGWTGDLTSTANPAQIVMNRAKAITAVFIEPGLMVSDDFDRCSLGSGIWEFVNPLDDASVSINGTQLRIAVPGTADHNVWKDGNNAPRLMQRANDVNFELRTRFQSPVNATSQMQGMIIEQDAGKYLRVDFSSIAAGRKLFAYGFDPALANPKKLIDLDVVAADVMELSITRNANTDRFTIRYRMGSDTEWTTAGAFTFVMDVKKVGVFAGNVKPKNGSTPAHTAIVDYFYNAADSEQPGDTPLLSISTIGTGTVQRNPAGPLYTCGTQVTLTPKPGLGWTFNGWSGDLTGSQSPASVTLNGPKSVVATFVGGGMQYNLLPMIIR